MAYLKRLLLSAGLEESEFDEIRSSFAAEDERILEHASPLTGVFFLLLSVAGYFSDKSLNANTVLYLAAGLVMLSIYALLRLKEKWKVAGDRITLTFVYLFISVLSLEAILVSMKHPEYPGVTYIGVMLCLPLLFIDRPLSIISALTFFDIIYCIAAGYVKYPEVAYMDRWNAVTFLVISAFVAVLMLPMRLGTIKQARKIEYLSEHDVLTGLRNRNSYELRLDKLSAGSLEGLVCIYADVNGLHELNDTEGHQAGDVMIQYVALGLRKAFGADDSYRFGGDEFIVLCLNRSEEEVQMVLRDLSKEYGQKNYHVAFGTAAAPSESENVRELVKLAEQRMYEAKNLYYEQTGKDRRER